MRETKLNLALKIYVKKKNTSQNNKALLTKGLLFQICSQFFAPFILVRNRMIKKNNLAQK